MSRSRIVINVILVLFLAGFLWILGRAWLRSNPERLLSSAEQEFAEGDFASAKVHLMSFLHDVPDSSTGHELMSKVLLKEAAAEGRPDQTLLTNEDARDHLQMAARLAPDNVEVHDQLLEVFLDGGALEAAAEVAEILIKAEPENPEAQLALFRRSVVAGDFAGGEERLAALRTHPSRRFFLQAQLEVDHFKGPEHSQQLTAVLDAAVMQAENTTAEQLIQMSQTEQLAIPVVMQQAIAQAPDVETAQHRASVALGICEKIAGSDLSNAAELSRFAADIMRVLRRDHPLNQATPEQRQERRDLEKRADVFLQAGMNSGAADGGLRLESVLAARFEDRRTVVPTVLIAAYQQRFSQGMPGTVETTVLRGPSMSVTAQ